MFQYSKRFITHPEKRGQGGGRPHNPIRACTPSGHSFVSNLLNSSLEGFTTAKVPPRNCSTEEAGSKPGSTHTTNLVSSQHHSSSTIKLTSLYPWFKPYQIQPGPKLLWPRPPSLQIYRSLLISTSTQARLTVDFLVSVEVQQSRLSYVRYPRPPIDCFSVEQSPHWRELKEEGQGLVSMFQISSYTCTCSVFVPPLRSSSPLNIWWAI